MSPTWRSLCFACYVNSTSFRLSKEDGGVTIKSIKLNIMMKKLMFFLSSVVDRNRHISCGGASGGDFVQPWRC